MSNVREEFEKWARPKGFDLTPARDQEPWFYKDRNTDNLLAAYTAALQSVGDAEDARRWRFRQQFLKDGGTIWHDMRGYRYMAESGCVGRGLTEQDAIDAALSTHNEQSA